MRMTSLARALVVGAVVGLTACGSGSGSTDGSSANSSGDLDCTSASASAVNAALGTDFGEPRATEGPDSVMCQYTSTSGPTTGIIRLQNGDTHEQFVASKATFDKTNQPVTDIAGIGDEAFSTTSKATNYSAAVNTVVARKGGRQVLVTSNASVDKEAALVRQLLG